jgi:NADH dehydrogenase
MNARRPRIVVVGGGAGGAELATALGQAVGQGGAEVTLVDCAASHLWKPRLHEVAAGLISRDEDAVPYLALGQVNHFRFQMGALTGIDAAAKTISIAGIAGAAGDLLGPRQIPYDTLVLAIGSQVNDFGVEGVVEHCHMLDNGEQAGVFQQRLLERAVQVSEGVAAELRIGIVGAGATGVELAVELHHAVSAMQRYGGLVGSDRLVITLIDMAPRVLANSDPHTSAFAERALRRLGVTVLLNASVARITAEALYLKSGEQIPCDLKVWASGIIGLPVAEQLKGLQIGRGRRIVCDSFLRCQGVENIYALGDCAGILDPKTGQQLPATAQVAHQQASHLVGEILASHRGHPPTPFKYRPMGSLVSLGPASAAAEFPTPRRGVITFSGALPKVFYVSLQLLHRAALLGWVRAVALSLADSLRRITAPPVKLH